MDLGALLTRLGPANVVAGVALLLGVVVLAVAIRAVGNAALALKARLFALGSGLALVGVGAGRPLGLDERLGQGLSDTFSTLGSPLEQAAILGALVVLAAVGVGLVLLYFWIRTMMRLAWLAFMGLAVLGVSLTVILAGEGVLPVPEPLRDSFVLAAIAGMLLVLWGVVRMLRRAVTAPVPKTA